MNSVFVIFTFVSAVFGANRDKLLVFKSVENQSGIIHSKDFPYSYNPIENEIFEFRGSKGENVQITFEYFNLFPKTTNEKCGVQSSSISYKKTSRSNEWEKLCGDKKPLPIMSDDEHLVLRYEAITVPSNMRTGVEEIGFNATYRFIKNYGIDYNPPNDERSNDPFGDRCEFTYKSEYFPTGLINSPNFPGMYPESMRCLYIFSGPETNILFQFTHFNLSGSENCNEDVETKDILEIVTYTDDGPGSPDKKSQYCGNKSPFNVTVTNSTALIIFYHKTSYPDSYLAGSDFVGFNASFLFTNETISSACDHRLSGISILGVSLYWTLNQRLHF